jgi:uncharacterized 2Fe-2S/4Fe-4S cluster protein (DUF4445 family)
MAHLMQSPGEPVPLHILPGDHVVDAAVGQPLRPYLAGRAVFACGGTGSCGKCRVRVVEGAIAVSEEMREVLSPREIAEGWRLACGSVIAGPLTIMIAPRARSDAAFAHCDREDGMAGRSYGVAVDVGTTTLAAALVDLASGTVVGRRGAMNPQSAWGADIMSRLQFALTDTRLTGVIRQAVGDLIAVVAGSSARRIETVVLVGNTVMHHLFAGYDLAPLSHVPFETPRLCDWTGSAASLQWKISPDATVRFVRPVGGFVGSDISAGLAACGMEDAERPSVFVDLGTNGEVVLGRRGHLVRRRPVRRSRRPASVAACWPCRARFRMSLCAMDASKPRLLAVVWPPVSAGRGLLMPWRRDCGADRSSRTGGWPERD